VNRSWEQPEGWPQALAGVDRLYAAYAPDIAAPGADAAIIRLIEVARDAGVRHIVLLSGRGEASARRVEDILFASGVPATVVRASWFIQNFTEGMLRDAVLTGVLAMPAGDVREPFVDVDDIAEVAVEALTGTGHVGRVHEVTGPQSLTFAELAALLSEIHGREGSTSRSASTSSTPPSPPMQDPRWRRCSPNSAARCSTAATNPPRRACSTRSAVRPTTRARC
jgi:uncharacterized protein YbjT (DUF2867 family)